MIEVTEMNEPSFFEGSYLGERERVFCVLSMCVLYRLPAVRAVRIITDGHGNVPPLLPA